MRGRVVRWALQAVGGVLLLLSVGTIGYAEWGEWQHRLQQPAGPQEALPERLDALLPRAASRETDDPSLPSTERPSFTEPAATETPGARVAEPEPATVVPSTPSPQPTTASSPTAVASPTPTPTPRPSYGHAVWINIPRIDVDASVAEVGVQDGVYQVPWWDVGHHEDSANPGEPGNSVFNGHLTTINAGRVFRRLKELKAGDAIYVYTRSHRTDWVVEELRTVPNTDASFIQPTSDTRITLYTCAGTFNPVTRDYSHRLVVVGRLVQVTPRT